MKVTTDQPGRFVAIFVLAPVLFATAYVLSTTCAYNECIARATCLLAIVFVVYEVFWIRTGVNRCYLGNIVQRA